ncbi:MAG: hypothetical protein A2784_01590 [Candidatus Chisholmbacteria bacterium RIFCSPHIGHO2_01_FULL_48_12]|uniref:PIN domain-containing protein n=1 Tax=Candidatus Chisholmbacteria bacterium RIFCSPHIGHO2_01_FULL_48_12 TaxID=1797589 RepID=A0A1G1VK49_9BACT|nr:MAG: hypothetical protein A2784_01590 [Candidatus Chisholmbacteria bacterium RIFCSPHIGHO2_01_FULL_48_12]
MGKIQVFLDTDVIISGLLSKTGAAFEIIKHPAVKKTISKAVKREIVTVTKRLKIRSHKSKALVKDMSVVALELTKSRLTKDYQRFVSDRQDCHVVAGAKASKSGFLLTHNLKHYQVDKIKTDLGIMVLKPGNFLQYLRSLS